MAKQNLPSTTTWGEASQIINANTTEVYDSLAQKVDKVTGSTLLTAQQASDLQAIKTLVVPGSADTDAVINAFNEVIAVFENSPEGFNIAQAFSLKLDIATFTAFQTALTTTLAGKVDVTRKVNGKGLDADVNLTKDDIPDGVVSKNFSPENKTKLEGIEDGATNYTDAKAIAANVSALALKVDKIAGSTLLSAQQAADLQAIKTLVIPGSADADAVINAFNEVISVFENSPEGFNIAQALSLKLDSATFTAFQNTVNTGLTKLAGIAPNATANPDTDTLPEGTTNKYFTDARALSATAAAIASAAGFQAETVTYQARVNATAGASISAADLLALDAFVLTGKNAGWWPAVKFFAPMMGNNLAAGLVKFVVDAGGIQSLGNVNFVEADYTQQFGFNVISNTTKGLTTGFIPSINNITPNSIGALVCTPLKTTAAGGGSYLVADSYSDANGKVPLLTFNGLWSSGASWIIPSNNTASSLLSLSPGGVKTQNLASVNGNVGNSYTNGISANTLTVGTSTAILNTEISLFRNLFGGTFRYTPGSLGGLMFTTGLTVAQNESLAKAYYILNRTIRRAHYETPLAAWFGDSIFGWIGSPTLGIPAIAGSGLSVFELNFGTPSSKVVGVNTFNAATPFLTRYLEIIRNGYGMSTIAIMGGINDLLTDPATNGTTATITAYQAALLTIYNAFKPIVPKVIAVGIPYNTNVTVTKMNAYNAANVAAVVSANLVYVDSFNIYLDSNNTASELLPDGTHPSLIYATLIGEHTAAAVMGKIYRDVKIPATLVTANSTVAFPVTMIGLRKSYVMQLGESQVTNTGISFTANYSSDNNATINIKNNTGADITTALTNIRLLFFLNF